MREPAAALTVAANQGEPSDANHPSRKRQFGIRRLSRRASPRNSCGSRRRPALRPTPDCGPLPGKRCVSTELPPAEAGSAQTRSPTPLPEAALRRPPQAPVDLRSGSLLFLAILAGILTLHWARAIFIPLMLAVMISVALSPIVAAMERRLRVPRALGAALLLLSALGAGTFTVYSLSDDAALLVAALPEAIQKVRDTFEKQQVDPKGTISKVKKAAAEIERAATPETPAPPSNNMLDCLARSGVDNIFDSITSCIVSGLRNLA